MRNTERITVAIERNNGVMQEHAVISIFNLNDETFAALVPLEKDGSPAAAEVSLYGCERDGDSFDLYEIEDEALYEKVSMAFRKVMQAL